MICETMSIWCWLIPAIVGIICAILGYFLGRLFGKNEISKYKIIISDLETCKLNNSNEINKNKAIISNLENDLAACRESEKYDSVSNVEKVSSAKSSVSDVKDAIIASAFSAAAAKLVFGKKIKEDDLTLVEGIGPKIEGLFHNFGIKTWKALSETSIEKCQEVLNSGGDRYRIHKPGTWPKQAGLAADGKFEELHKLQEELHRGK